MIYYTLLTAALALVGYAGWAIYGSFSGSFTTSEANTHAFVALFLLFVLGLITRFFKNRADRIESGESVMEFRHSFAIKWARKLIGEAERQLDQQLISSRDEARAKAKETLAAARRMATTLHEALPVDKRPLKFNSAKMSLEELEAFCAEAVKTLKDAGERRELAPISVSVPADTAALSAQRTLLETTASRLWQIGVDRSGQQVPSFASMSPIELSEFITAEGTRIRESAAEARQSLRDERAEHQAALERLGRDHEAELAALRGEFAKRDKTIASQKAQLEERVRNAAQQESRWTDGQAILERERSAHRQTTAQLAESRAQNARLTADMAAVVEQVEQLSRQRTILRGRVRKLVEAVRFEREIATEADSKASEANERANEADKTARDATARADAMKKRIDALPPFVSLRHRVAAALSSADALVKFVKEMGEEPDQREQGLLAFLTTEGAAARVAKLINELVTRANELDQESREFDRAVSDMDAVLEFVYEGLDRLAFSFLEILEDESLNDLPIGASTTLASVLFGLGLSNQERWTRFRANSEHCWKAVGRLPQGVRMGMAETAASTSDFLVLAIGTPQIRKAVNVIEGLSSLDNSTLARHHGLTIRAEILRSQSALQDPLGLRRRRALIELISDSKHRAVFREATNQLSLLYGLSPTRWRTLLTVLHQAETPGAEYSVDELKELLGFDPRYILAFLDTREETLVRFDVLRTLEPIATIAEMAVSTRERGSVLGPLMEYLEAYLYGTSPDKPRHRSDLKTATGRLENIRNVCDRIVQLRR